MFFKRNKEESNNNIYLKEAIDSISYINRHKEVVYIFKGKWYEFVSNRAYDSWRLDPVYVTGFPPLPQPYGGTLGFRDGTLIQNAKDGKIYVISNAKKRLLTAPLGDYGFDYSQVVEVSDAEAEFHSDGEEL